MSGVVDTPADECSATDGAMTCACICLLMVLWSLFAVFVFGRFTQLGDSDAYLSDGFDGQGELRTRFVTGLSSLASSVLGATGAHLAFAMLSAAGWCDLVRQAHAQRGHRWPVAWALLNPNVAIWTSVVGREAMICAALCSAMASMLALLGGAGGARTVALMAAVALLAFLRPPYGAAVGVCAAVVFMTRWLPASGIGASTWCALALPPLAVLIMAGHDALAHVLDDIVLPSARSYFTVHSPTTRAWVDLADSRTFLASLPWAVPLALLGPTWGEVLQRPVFAPFMAGGLVIMGMLASATWQALVRSAPRFRTVLCVGWLPATVMLLLAYTPFGVYNPGSAIRYLSCIVPFFLFPWLLPARRRAFRSARGQAAC